ncbi:MAG: hypothetical protein FWG44_04415 [Oscillospiraceae bacterium]|nr:hypothetical protein [Oscillospiraceae bacterium]
MTYFGKKLDHFYRRLGDRGFMLVLFAAGLTFHIILVARMNVPSVYPDEFGTAARSAYFSGFNASRFFVNESVSAWLTAALYTPFYYLFKEPALRYRCMLVLNGIIAGFIPLLTYKITGSAGLKKAWQKTLCAICTALCVSVFAYTKFIWSETLCVFFPFLLLLVFIKSLKVKYKILRGFLSVFTAFLITLSLFADLRLWVLALVFILTVIYTKSFLYVKSVSFTAFLPAFGVLSVFWLYAAEYLKTVAAGEGTSGIIASPSFGFGFAGFKTFFAALSGGLYYFTVSTWGIGILGACFCISNLLEYKKSKKNHKNKSPEELIFAAFAFFALAYNVLMLFANAFYIAGTGQDAYLFGRYIDSAVPVMLVFTLCYFFIHGLELRKVLASVTAQGAVFVLFFITAVPMVTAGENKTPRVESLQGLSPVRLGFEIDAPFTFQNLLYTVSATFCFSALLIVLVCCAKHYRAHIASFCMVLTVLYSGIHTAFIYLPYETDRAERENKGAYTVSEYIYNSSDAPPTYVVGAGDEFTHILRFLNRDAYIGVAGSFEELPENCFIVINVSEKNASEAIRIHDFAVILAEAEGLVFAAKGERAEAYALSQE